MSICSSGMNLPVLPGSILIAISGSHPLIQLAKMIPWAQFETIVIPDLKQSTSKCQWWLGRKLKLRSFTFIARYATPNNVMDFKEMIHLKTVLWITILKESLPVWVYLKELPIEANKALPCRWRETKNNTY